eukprot:COSAG06_NODE_34_length_31045_cov_28.806469_2_plen_772_part_00
MRPPPSGATTAQLRQTRRPTSSCRQVLNAGAQRPRRQQPHRDQLAWRCALVSGLTLWARTTCWAKARIVAVEVGQVRVHFTGFANQYDEWIPVEDGGSRRLALPGAVTDAGSSDADGRQLEELADNDSQDSDDEPEGPARSRRRGGRGRPTLQAGKQRKPKQDNSRTLRSFGDMDSKYVGVTFCPERKSGGHWHASIQHPVTHVHVDTGWFQSDEQAARAYDIAARRLRGAQAHGGGCSLRSRSGQVVDAGQENMWRLNFPTQQERAAAPVVAAPDRAQTAADVAASVLLSQEAVAKRTAAGESTSSYHGVRWFKDDRHARWRSQILDDSTGKQIALGTFIDEVAAARAYDAAAREAHGDKAHGWPSRNRKRRWLNFPTAEEIAAVPAGSVDPAAIKAGAEAKKLASERLVARRKAAGQQTSPYVGVSFIRKQRVWKAEIHVGTEHGANGKGKVVVLGRFLTEEEAARAIDDKAREVRGEKADGFQPQSSMGYHVSAPQWLNFPTPEEEERRLSKRPKIISTSEELSAAGCIVERARAKAQQAGAAGGGKGSQKRRWRCMDKATLTELYAVLHARMPQPVTEAALSEEFSSQELGLLLKHNGVLLCDYDDEGTGKPYTVKTKASKCKALVSAAPTMIVPGTEGDSECAAVMQAQRRKSAKRGAKPMGDVYALLHARMPQPVTEAALSEEFGYKELHVLLTHNGVPIRDYDEGTGSYIEKTKGLNCKALVAVAPTMIVPGTQGEIDSPTGGAVVRRRKSARGAAKARGSSDF